MPPSSGKNSYEEVNQPAHYGDNEYPTIDLMEDCKLGPAYCITSLIRYISRGGKKPGAELATELKKCVWCVDRLRSKATSDILYYPYQSNLTSESFNLYCETHGLEGNRKHILEEVLSLHNTIEFNLLIETLDQIRNMLIEEIGKTTPLNSGKIIGD